MAFFIIHFLLVVFIFISDIDAQQHTSDKKIHAHQSHIMLIPSDLEWVDGPDVLPEGVKIVMLEGDLSKTGPFTFRARVPANYKIAPHFHPAAEHITVLSGSFYMGLGDKLNESSATELSAGSFAVMEIGTHHFAFTKTETEIQVHGNGQWGVIYVNPDDDPRNKRNR